MILGIEAEKLLNENRIKVTKVINRTPAQAILKKDDIIISFDKKNL